MLATTRNGRVSHSDILKTVVNMVHATTGAKPWDENPDMGWLVNSLIWVLEKAQKLGLKYPQFSEERLMALARRKTGLDDFGDPRFLEPLRLRVAYLRDTHRLNPLGLIVARRALLKPLINRLRIQALLKRHPEILEQRIEKPLFVAAFPRTGTTLLNRLLALDPAARPLMFWESMDPIPHQLGEPREGDSRIPEAVRMVEQMRRMLPAMRKIHDIDPLGPEECTGLLATAFILPNYEEDNLAYRQWKESLSHAEVCAAYEEYKIQLQVLQWQHGGGHWMLKCPLHLHWLDALLTVFPDACVVQTHRDPKQALPSICSLHAVMQQAACRGDVDCEAVGRHLSAQMLSALKASMQARANHPAERIYDAPYHELVRDPVAVVKNIYKHFGYDFSAAMERNILEFMAENPQHKHGSHKYSLEDFGLSAQKMDQDFAEYYRRFPFVSA